MTTMNIQALQFWKQAVSNMLALNCDLSTRQMAILLKVYLENGPHTVKNLSETLGISKAAISRALDALSQLGYIRRKRDAEDLRIVHVQRTVEGSVFLSDLSAIITEASRRQVQKAMA